MGGADLTRVFFTAALLRYAKRNANEDFDAHPAVIKVATRTDDVPPSQSTIS